MAGQWHHKTLRNVRLSVNGCHVDIDAHGNLNGELNAAAVKTLGSLPAFTCTSVEKPAVKASEPAEAASKPAEAAPAKKPAKASASKKKSSPKKK